MLISFFPAPKWLLFSFLLRLLLAVAGWHLGGAELGTGFLALVGIKLPTLEFRNQRVKAAYRKELVYGEDGGNRTDPMTVSQLFSAVRKNYFTLYFHCAYLARIFYLQADNIFPFIVLAPTIVAGKITLGLMNQILYAFGQVRASLQYLITSWPAIVDLLSIHKRLKAFEASIADGPLSWVEIAPGIQPSDSR